jgi:hypothetical protein
MAFLYVIESETGRKDMSNLILRLLLILFCASFSQDVDRDRRWEDFKTKTEGYYHFLEKSELENFKCSFTSTSYLNFIEKYQDSTYNYPLNMIWIKAGKIYFILKEYPVTDSDTARQKIMQNIQLTKNQFHGFYLDFLNFLILSPLSDVSESVEYTFSEDSIKVCYSAIDSLGTEVTKIFHPSGQLYKVVVVSPTEKILNYPKYREVDDKWLCTGWDTQIIQDGEIRSGIATRLKLNKIKGFWLPVQVDFIVQTVEKPGEKFYSTLFIKNYQFNLPLQEIENPREIKK